MMDDYIAEGLAPGLRTSAPARLEAMRVKNGYVITFRRSYDRNLPPPGPPLEDGMSEEERIDAMVEAIAAFIGFINDKGAGEDWKSGGNREKIRAGFKAMVPRGFTHQHSVFQPPPEPEQLVFKSKQELISFIEENF